MRREVYSFLVALSKSDGFALRDVDRTLDSYQIARLKSQKLVIVCHNRYYITDAGRKLIAMPCNYPRFLTMMEKRGEVTRTDLIRSVEDIKNVEEIKNYALDNGYSIVFTDRNWILKPAGASS